MDWSKLKNSGNPGWETAWDEAFEELKPLAKRGARFQCPGLSEDEQNDVAMQAIGEMIEKLETFSSYESFRGQLFDCAKKRAIDLTRKRGRTKKLLDKAEALQDEKMTGEGEPLKTTDSAEEAITHAEHRSIAADILDQLSDEDAKLLKQRFLQEIIQREIGEMSGKNPKAIGNLIEQALARARKLLSSDKRLNELFDP